MTLPMLFLTAPQQPPIITGVPIPYPSFAEVSRTVQVLHFDEADATFGKRTELRATWRRYAVTGSSQR